MNNTKSQVINIVGFIIGATVVFTVLATNRPEAFLWRYNPYAILSGAGLLSNFILLIVLTRLRTQTSSIFLFSFFLYGLMFYAGGEFFQRLSATPQGALFWSQISASGRVALPLLFFFYTLSHLKKDRLLRNQNFIFLHVSFALFFVYLIIATRTLLFNDVSHMTAEAWGFYNPIAPYFWVFVIWLELLFISGVVLLLQRYYASHNHDERQQLLIICLSILIPLIGGTITEGILPILGHDVLPLAMLFTTISAFMVTYAMDRYSLFLFNPATLATNILETMRESVLALDVNYTIQYTNRRAEELLQVKDSELLGTSFKNLFASLEKNEELLTSMGEKSFTESKETKIIARDGTYIPVSLSAAQFMNDMGQVSGYIVAITDITALANKVEEVNAQNKQLEQLDHQLREEKAGVEKKVKERTAQLEEVRARLLASINSLELGFVMTDNHNSIVMANRSAFSLLLKSANASGQRDPSDLASLGNSALTIDYIQTQLKEHVSLIEEIKKSTNTQQPIMLKSIPYGKSYLQIFLSPIILNNEVIGTVILIQDITEARILERSKDEFFTIASHELRTPLALIRGYTALIKKFHAETLQQNNDLSDKINNIEASCIHLITIVNDFLNLSWLEQGRTIFKKMVFDILPIIEKVKEDMTVMAEQKKLSITIESTQSSIPPIFADQERTKQVLINLVTNAIKYTDKGGIIIRIKQNGPDTLLIQVQDSGIGIPLKNQSLLFHKFQQAGESYISRDSSGGTGLGLYISRLLVEGMGGKIYLERSIPGEGSIFSFTLPIEPKDGELPVSPMATKVDQNFPPPLPTIDAAPVHELHL